MKSSRLAAVLLPLMFLCSCNTTAPDIVGTWEGEGERFGQWTLEIRKLGIALWTVDDQTHELHINYHTNDETDLIDFDLYGFEFGPLVDRVLYGIFEFVDPDTLRWEVMEGPPGPDGESLRPTTFNPRTVNVMKRIRPGGTS